MTESNKPEPKTNLPSGKSVAWASAAFVAIFFGAITFAMNSDSLVKSEKPDERQVIVEHKKNDRSDRGVKHEDRKMNRKNLEVESHDRDKSDRKLEGDRRYFKKHSKEYGPKTEQDYNSPEGVDLTAEESANDDAIKDNTEVSSKPSAQVEPVDPNQ